MRKPFLADMASAELWARFDKIEQGLYEARQLFNDSRIRNCDDDAADAKAKLTEALDGIKSLLGEYQPQ